MASIQLAQTPVEKAKAVAKTRRQSIREDTIGPGVVKEAAELYEQPTIKNQEVKHWTHWPSVKMGTAHYDSTGKLVHSGSGLDLGNVFGFREKKIQELLKNDDFRDAIKKGPDATGRYSALDDGTRFLHKITDEDLTKALHADQTARLENNPEYLDALEDLTPEQRAKITSTSDIGETLRMVENNNVTGAMETQIRDMDKGTEWLKQKEKELGRPLTQDELESLTTSLRPEQTLEIRAKASHESGLENDTSMRDRRSAQTDLERIQAYNSNEIERSKIEYNNNVAGYNHNIAQRKQDMDWETGNLDRELRKDLAIMGFDSKQTDREYEDRRDARSNRQLMILQMMKGLQGFGQSFGAY